MRSCRTAPGSPGTWTIMYGSASLPIASACAFFSALHRLLFSDPTDVSRMSFRCRRFTPGRVVVCLVEAQVLRGCFARFRPIHHDRLYGRRQELGVMDIRPGDHRTQRASVLVDDHAPYRPVFPAIRRVRPDLVPAEPSLAHRAVGALPLPADTVEFLALGDHHGPDLLHHAVLVPALEPAADRTVVAELLGQVVPLASGPHAEDDPVERLTPVGPLPAPLGRWGRRGVREQDRLDLGPQLIRDFPDGLQRLDRSLLPSHRLASLFPSWE